MQGGYLLTLTRRSLGISGPLNAVAPSTQMIWDSKYRISLFISVPVCFASWPSPDLLGMDWTYPRTYRLDPAGARYTNDGQRPFADLRARSVKFVTRPNRSDFQSSTSTEKSVRMSLATITYFVVCASRSASTKIDTRYITDHSVLSLSGDCDFSDSTKELASFRVKR